MNKLFHKKILFTFLMLILPASILFSYNDEMLGYGPNLPNDIKNAIRIVSDGIDGRDKNNVALERGSANMRKLESLFLANITTLLFEKEIRSFACASELFYYLFKLGSNYIVGAIGNLKEIIFAWLQSVNRLTKSMILAVIGFVFLISLHRTSQISYLISLNLSFHKLCILRL